MSHHTQVLFLHGVGDGDPTDGWKAVLSDSLQRLGYPRLDDVEVAAPKYAYALKGVDDDVPVPPLTVKAPARDAARQLRRDFERRIGAVEFRLGRPDRGAPLPLADAIVDAAMFTPQLLAARNYLSNAKIRAAVLERVLKLCRHRGVSSSLGTASDR